MSLSLPLFLQHRKNKNIQLLIRVFHRLLHEGSVDPEMKLLVIGITGPETARIHQLVSDLRLDRRVVFLQGLPEPVLQWCYTNCKVLVAPSETEGFGLPVAEAMLAGCRIVCSDIPAFREIDEGHCRFVALGPGAEKGFADAILASAPGTSKVSDLSSTILNQRSRDSICKPLPWPPVIGVHLGECSTHRFGSGVYARKAVAMTDRFSPKPQGKVNESDRI